MIKNNFIIIFILFFCYSFIHTSEKTKVYTPTRILVDKWLDEKKLAHNVLVSLGCDDKLFVCYLGNYVEPAADYRRGPAIETNIFTEIDLYTKKEYPLFHSDDLKEICNGHPVNDIARWKNNYCIAHQKSIYICQSDDPWFTSPTLSKTKQLECRLSDVDRVKKIFIDKDENIVAISSRGIILKSSLLKNEPMEALTEPFSSEEMCSSYAYNSEHNMILLGGNNFVKIVFLNNTEKIFLLSLQNLNINTIDTNSDYILLSDVVQKTNRQTVHNYKGHLKKKIVA